jgi:quercetin dioxygenase-like cupin family protein
VTDVHRLGGIRDIGNRPGMRGRNLIGTEHGVTSLFVGELHMEQGCSIPLHTHPTEEVFVVTEGTLTLRLGDQSVSAGPDSVVCIPPGVPHAVTNQEPETARALTAGAWNRATWFSEGTNYLEGLPRSDT